MDEKFNTIDNAESFEKIATEYGVVYMVKNYPGPIAMDAEPEKDLFTGKTMTMRRYKKDKEVIDL